MPCSSDCPGSVLIGKTPRLVARAAIYPMPTAKPMISLLQYSQAISPPDALRSPPTPLVHCHGIELLNCGVLCSNGSPVSFGLQGLVIANKILSSLRISKVGCERDIGDRDWYGLGRERYGVKCL